MQFATAYFVFSQSEKWVRHASVLKDSVQLLDTVLTKDCQRSTSSELDDLLCNLPIHWLQIIRARTAELYLPPTHGDIAFIGNIPRTTLLSVQIYSAMSSRSSLFFKTSAIPTDKAAALRSRHEIEIWSVWGATRAFLTIKEQKTSTLLLTSRR